jgi:predicted DNA-binding transcriptional regulator AlpA
LTKKTSPFVFLFGVHMSQKIDRLEPMFTINQFRTTLQISRTTFFRLSKRGLLPVGTKVGNGTRWPASVVREYIDNLPKAGT